MNLEKYSPKDNRIIVYSNTNGNIADRLNGIVTSFLLALLNDYHFRIAESNMLLHNIFNSDYDWKNEDWYDGEYKRGRLNLNDILNDEKHWLEDVVITDEIPNAEVLNLFINENGLKYIFNNENYNKRLEELDLEYNTAYSQLLTYLFNFNGKYEKNFYYLLDRLYLDEGNPMSVHIRNIQGDENITNSFMDAIKKHSSPNSTIFLSSDNESIIKEMKSNLSGLKIISLPNNIVFDNDGDIKESDLVKLYYEMFLQANCTKHIISPWSGFSKLIATLSADDIVVVEDKNNPQFNIKIEGYTKLRLDEFLEII